MANTTAPEATTRQSLEGPIDLYSFAVSTRQMVRDAKNDDSEFQAAAPVVMAMEELPPNSPPRGTSTP